MKNLLLNLGLATTLISPLQIAIMNNTNNTNQQKINNFALESYEGKEKFDFSISHSKHWEDNKFVPGKKDYTEEFKSAYHKATNRLRQLCWVEFLIEDFQGHLVYDEEKPINFSKESQDKMFHILKSKKTEVIKVEVDIQEQTYKDDTNSIKLFNYDINYEVNADGKVIIDSLSVYNKDDLFSENNFLNPYQLSLIFIDDSNIKWEAYSQPDNRWGSGFKLGITDNRQERIIHTKWNINLDEQTWYECGFYPTNDFFLISHWKDRVKSVGNQSVWFTWREKPENVNIHNFRMKTVGNSIESSRRYVDFTVEFDKNNRGKGEWIFEFSIGSNYDFTTSKGETRQATSRHRIIIELVDESYII